MITYTENKRKSVRVQINGIFGYSFSISIFIIKNPFYSHEPKGCIVKLKLLRYGKSE